MCDCAYTPDPDNGDEAGHYVRTCPACSRHWRDRRHCLHSPYQCPCPHCGVSPEMVPDPTAGLANRTANAVAAAIWKAESGISDWSEVGTPQRGVDQAARGREIYDEEKAFLLDLGLDVSDAKRLAMAAAIVFTDKVEATRKQERAEHIAAFGLSSYIGVAAAARRQSPDT